MNQTTRRPLLVKRLASRRDDDGATVRKSEPSQAKPGQENEENDAGLASPQLSEGSVCLSRSVLCGNQMEDGGGEEPPEVSL